MPQNKAVTGFSADEGVNTAALAVFPAEAGDVAALASIERECFSESAWSENALLDELALPGSIVLAARRAGVLCGYISCRQVLCEGYIGNVAVLPGFRRRGVAKALLAALCEVAEQRGLSFLTLEVRSTNTAAITLYERLHFAPVGTRRGFYSAPREDALLMSRIFHI